MTTLRQSLSEAASRLAAAGVGTPARDARRLLAHVLDINMGTLTIRLQDALGTDDKERFELAIGRRAAREPVSHIVGYRDFWKGRFRVTADVLDPRPETETLVALALEAPFTRVLDLGTGSGAILISLLMERPDAIGVGIDISEKAVLLAGENAELNGVAERITLPISDWFEDVGGRYDLIVSNPPYIAAAEMAGLDPEVREFEPDLALTDNGDGLSAYREIARNAPALMLPGGRLLVEIGASQAQDVAALISATDLEDVTIHTDLNDKTRVISAISPRNTA